MHQGQISAPNSGIFIFVELHLNGLKWGHIENVVTIIQRRLLVIERRESSDDQQDETSLDQNNLPHTLEVATITFLATHHDPHRTPLRNEQRLDDKRNLVYEGDGTGDMIKHLNIANLASRASQCSQELERSPRTCSQGMGMFSISLMTA